MSILFYLWKKRNPLICDYDNTLITEYDDNDDDDENIIHRME